MPTNREIISDIRGTLNAANVDGWIPSALIYSKLSDVSSLFIKREADNMQLFRYAELWTTVNCLEMEEMPLIQCCNLNIPNCKTVMRSKEKLPKMYSTRFGYLITVSSVDYDRNYKPTTPQDFKYTTSRRFPDPRIRYFWIENDYLVIPNSMVSRVNITIMAPDKAEALKLNSCDDSPEKDCLNFMDQEFVAPAHLLDDIKTYATQKLLPRTQVQPDEYPNKNVIEKTNPQP